MGVGQSTQHACSSLSTACQLAYWELCALGCNKMTCFYQCLRLCSCGTKPQRSENHHFVMTSSWEPQCHHDIIMRTPRITGKPKFSCSGGILQTLFLQLNK